MIKVRFLNSLSTQASTSCRDFHALAHAITRTADHLFSLCFSDISIDRWKYKRKRSCYDSVQETGCVCTQETKLLHVVERPSVSRYLKTDKPSLVQGRLGLSTTTLTSLPSSTLMPSVSAQIDRQANTRIHQRVNKRKVV